MSIGKTLKYPTSWGSVLAGVFVAFGVQLLLTLFGMTIGLISPAVLSNPLTGIMPLTEVWLIVSSIISMYVGGFLTGRLATTDAKIGRLHGLVLWGLYATVSMFFVNTILGTFVGGPNVIVGLGLGYLGGFIPKPTDIPFEEITRLTTNGAIYSLIGTILTAVTAYIGGSMGAEMAHREMPKYETPPVEVKRELPRAA